MEFLLIILLVLVAFILLQNYSIVGGYIPHSSSPKYVSTTFKLNGNDQFSEIWARAYVEEDKKNYYQNNDPNESINKLVKDRVKFFMALYNKDVLKFIFNDYSYATWIQLNKQSDGNIPIGDMIAYQKIINSDSYTKEFIMPVLNQMPQEAKNLSKEAYNKIFSPEAKYYKYDNKFQALGGTRKNIWNIEIRNFKDEYSIITPDLYKKFTVKKDGTPLEKMKSIINEEQKKGFLGYKSFEYRLNEYIKKNIPDKEDFSKQLEKLVEKVPIPSQVANPTL